MNGPVDSLYEGRPVKTESDPDDDDMGAMFRALREERAQKRAKNRADSAKMLADRKIEFTSNNGGAHLIVKALGQSFDFWPGTGLWIKRGGPGRQKQYRGVHRLIQACTPEDNG